MPTKQAQAGLDLQQDSCLIHHIQRDMRRECQQCERQRLHQPCLGRPVTIKLYSVRYERLGTRPTQACMHAFAHRQTVGRHHAFLLQHHHRQRQRGRVRPLGSKRVEWETGQVHRDPERHDREGFDGERPTKRRAQLKTKETKARPAISLWLDP